MNMIKEVYVHDKEVSVRYESETWRIYRKACDMQKNMSGVQQIPQTVIEFMRKHPNKVH